jgi:phenylacetate-coenzyme A ligase PaaK-like adenylate-forming protein
MPAAGAEVPQEPNRNSTREIKGVIVLEIFGLLDVHGYGTEKLSVNRYNPGLTILTIHTDV